MSVTVDAVADVPRAFWRGLDVMDFELLVKTKRLTMPERESLWSLLARPGEVPRHISLSVPAEWEGASRDRMRDVLRWLLNPHRMLETRTAARP